MDVLAELVPPPPEFAAPPPGHPGAKGQPTMSQLQSLSQQRQQQLQDLRHKQMMRQMPSAQAPPIPSQPPPATLPHMCQTKEQIRILSPQPSAMSAQPMSGHHSHNAQHYQRISNQQVLKDRGIAFDCNQFYNSYANNNSIYYWPMPYPKDPKPVTRMSDPNRSAMYRMLM